MLEFFKLESHVAYFKHKREVSVGFRNRGKSVKAFTLMILDLDYQLSVTFRINDDIT